MASRDSFSAALKRFIAMTLETSFDGLLNVSPQKKNDDFIYIQPAMSPGGHALGAEERNINTHDAIAEGCKILDDIEKGIEYVPHDPNHVITILMALAYKNGDINMVQYFAQFVSSSKHPIEKGMNIMGVDTFIDKTANTRIRDFIETVPFNQLQMLSWKMIRKLNKSQINEKFCPDRVAFIKQNKDTIDMIQKKLSDRTHHIMNAHKTSIRILDYDFNKKMTRFNKDENAERAAISITHQTATRELNQAYCSGLNTNSNEDFLKYKSALAVCNQQYMVNINTIKSQMDKKREQARAEYNGPRKQLIREFNDTIDMITAKFNEELDPSSQECQATLKKIEQQYNENAELQAMIRNETLTIADCRKIVQLVNTIYPKKQILYERMGLRDAALTPVNSTNPVYDFIVRCWQLRPSSISMNLIKTPPQLVFDLLTKANQKPDDVIPKILRSRIIEKMNVFNSYVIKTFGVGSNPSQWSDTLSHFAKAINPVIQNYNKMCMDQDLIPFAHATSFVPADLAPSMYRGNNYAYFFVTSSSCYSYSQNWRRDAVRAVNNGTMPADVTVTLGNFDRIKFSQITDKIAYDGEKTLMDALVRTGVTSDTFITFLRKYYFSGAFIKINLN